GTTAEHVRVLAELAAEHRPRAIIDHHRAMVSGLEAVELTSENRPLLVGERTNVLGSRKFKRLIAAGELEGAAEVGRAQVRGGAQIIDVCLQDPDRDELADMEHFLDRLTRLVKVPLMIDSTDAAVMERALTYCQGKSILNSINLEDGRRRFDSVVPLARRFGAALVVGLIDEEGMAVSAARKLEVARASFAILNGEMGVRPEDIWWDALVFPCGTGDESYIGSAASTLEAVRSLKGEYPLSRTILGISNVSFGLPPAGREVLNSVFLYHATQAGLDAAIVNSERLARYAEIPEEERELAERLLFLKPGQVAESEEAVARFSDHFRDRDSMPKRTPRSELELAERLTRAVVEGTKVGLDDDLAAALEDPRWPEPLAIINGPLMAGMAEVGRLFNDNKLIVAEVLQSAEVMKAAVAYLEPYMEKSGGRRRGRVLLATVKGDVHDIGKNLVDIVLSNNGFEVINLGIKVPSDRLIEATREQQPDVIGLSGLLVKSAGQMVTTAADLSAAGIDVPLLVGGAALTRRFTHGRIAPAYGRFCTYARDAMDGLSLVERLTDAARRPALEAEVAEAVAALDLGALESATEASEGKAPGRSSVRRDLVAPEPSDLRRHVEILDLDQVWAEMNEQMLYSKHLGVRGVVEKLVEAGDRKVLELSQVIEELKGLARDGAMSARAVWQFFPARSEERRIILLDTDRSREVASWEFPRQTTGAGLCLADYVSSEEDHVALLVTTA
ncbi:MAG TPA: dihydropteroate synthase, partial [Thermoanaerobaculia bacterium]|nr:dihydropteroate synthase [Thermoanaerobaculia bacterium]